MENQQSSLLSWVYNRQGKTMEELRHSLIHTTLRVQHTRMLVHEDIKKRDDQLVHLNDLLDTAMKERDEAQDKFQSLVLQRNLLLQKQVSKNVSEREEVPRKESEFNNNGFSSSDCDESIVSSFDQFQELKCLHSSSSSSSPVTAGSELGFPYKRLPEKGRLLQAVIKAGPLLQTLLVAGPLPQWRNPPPLLGYFEIPPISISSPQCFLDPILVSNSCGKVNRKRVLLSKESDSPRETKFQREVYH